MLRHHWYSGLPQHAPDIPVLTPPIRDPFETRHVLTKVSEKYWSKLVTSQVYLEKPSDIVAVLEAPFGAGGEGVPSTGLAEAPKPPVPCSGACGTADQWIWFNQELMGACTSNNF